jgi:hypothetical protein
MSKITELHDAVKHGLHHLAVQWEGLRANGSSFPTRQYNNGSAPPRSSAHLVEWSEVPKTGCRGRA